ncbi:endonuclease exonuclease phosphatase [Moniliophthora roreri MCA 2997]|uniref:Endonuclease exonuclease phosphatase n=2 Tax=Moniliophthora roreri TaxID=221103 RepID=V2WQU0_MONRO|nr:endonuclease exonuclease phosphatase [Moniliophthora roreri MCA 2997]KAI3610133.1 endonuclease exonuclease phosphatase [Moniliophthora roreri]
MIASLLLSAALVSHAFAATSGSFSVLTYNVAGLPELLSSGNPETNTPLISPKLAPYNIIHVQEDFNYHAALYANDNHAYRTPTSGGVPFGSGLNTLSDFPYTDLERITWSKCNLNEGDCLTPKGFTFMRVRVADGVLVDFYNLHTDAGSDSGDRDARTSNFAQVRDYIAKWSQGMPVVVMGDTNSRYTSDVDSDSLHNILDAAGLTDSWVKNVRGGSFPVKGTSALTCPFPFASGTSQSTINACETVDKFLVRGSTAVSLVASSFKNDHLSFVNSSGAPLSDHYPLLSTLTWTLSDTVRLSDPIAGGPHGDPFTDLPSLNPVKRLSSVTIRAGDRVDAVSINGGTARGGSGGTASTLTLGSNERVTQVTGCTGKKSDTSRVFYVKFTTDTGKVLEGGKSTSDCQTVNAPDDGWGLVGFWGRSGDEVDRLGIVWGKV